MSRILCVDPGEKRIGMALSDPTGSIANPLMVIEHTSRPVDAARIADLANEYQVTLIVVGQPLDADGQIGPQARKSERLGEAIKTQTQIPVTYWDESGSTQTARQARVMMGVTRAKRKGHLDDLAATVILQTFLDSQNHVEGQIL